MVKRAALHPLTLRGRLRRKWAYSGAFCCALGLALLFGLFWGAGPSLAGPAPTHQPHAYGYFDFPTCVRYALVHSERMLKSRIEIQVKSVDLKDAHSELLPTLQLIVRYYFARATGASGGPVNVQILMTDWNPYVALLKIRAQGTLVDIAKDIHFEKISADVAQIAKLFYTIHLLEKNIRANRQILALYRNKVTYGKSRDEQGAADPIELKTWEALVRSENVKIKRFERDMADKVAQLKVLIGYHPDHYLPLDTRDAPNQILTGFNGHLVTFTDIQGSNLKLAVAAKKEQVQGTRIMGSYVALLPRPVFVLEDLQNQVDRTSGFNLALGLDYTLWDGFKRVRDIKRQKLEGQKLNLDRRLLSQKLYVEYQKLRGELAGSPEREATLREQASLAALREERALSEYKAGRLTHDVYVDRRVDTALAQIDAVNSVKERVFALIDLATIAGGLNRYNAAIRH